MTNDVRRALLLGGAVLLLALGGWPNRGHADSARQAATPVPGSAMSLGGNLLLNPNFEEGFSQREDGAVNVALHWTPWFIVDPAHEHARRPEWSREYLWLPSMRVLHGDFGQKVFNSWAVHDAGIYQTVRDVPIGATLEFSAWVQVWSSECDNICLSPTTPDLGCRGLTNGDYAVAVGIDPRGGAPVRRAAPLPDGIVWSSFRTDAYDHWVRVSVQAVAQSDTVTVYTRSKPDIAVKHNDSYWDTADLRIITSPADGWPATATPRPAAPIPSPAAAPAVSRPTAPTPTVTPVATLPATPERGCWEALTNGGVESADGWRLGADQPATVSSARAHEGRSALRLGGPASQAGLAAEAWREVYIPPDVNRATLRFWAWREALGAGPEPVAAASGQSVVVETLSGAPLAYAIRPHRANDGGWRTYELDLTGYRGQNVRVRFRVTAAAGDTVLMDVDDVSVDLCRPDGPRARARQAENIIKRVDMGQQGGGGVRLAYLRGSVDQPDVNPFPDECNAAAFEFVELENFGPPVNLAGWTLADHVGNVYTFPYFIFPPGYRIRVWTAAGPDFVGPTVADFHAGFNREMWGDRGDTVAVRDASGEIVTWYTYTWED